MGKQGFRVLGILGFWAQDLELVSVMIQLRFR